MRSIEVVDTYVISIGEVAFLTFDSGERPYPGMVLVDESGYQWKIQYIGGNRSQDLPTKYSGCTTKDVWDCIVKPLNHTMPLHTGHFLEIK